MKTTHFFKTKTMIIDDIKFDFDDILIQPEVKTHVASRYKDIKLPKTLPIFTAPMDTVVDLKNMDMFMDNGINVTLPRTIKYKDYLHFIRNKNAAEYSKVFVSMGFEELDFFYKENFKAFNTGQHILIDVANGHMVKVMDYAREIKRLRPDIILMVGNIANPETYEWYAKIDCIDYIRIGIGNGGGCLTTKQSGIGYPMASLIYETYLVKQEFIKNNEIDIKNQNTILHTKPVKTIPAIVADGGMKDHSDIIKALALGADYVMVGSIFNKALESCAQNYIHGFKIGKRFARMLFDNGKPVMKHFRGMSTKGAQKAMGKTSFKTSEGVNRYRKVEYHLDGWVKNFIHYLRNAMSYTNTDNLDDYRAGVKIIRITSKAYDRFNK